MSNDTTIEDALSGSCGNRGNFHAELGDGLHHCPGCLCRNRRLYCDDCIKSKRQITKSKRQKTLLATIYTISVAAISASVYHYFNDSWKSKQEPFYTQWMNLIWQIYS